MLWTFLIILLFPWAPGFIGGYTLGGFLHLLLLVALIVLVVNLIRGRRVI